MTGLWMLVDMVVLYFTYRRVGRPGVVVYVIANLLGFAHGYFR